MTWKNKNLLFCWLLVGLTTAGCGADQRDTVYVLAAASTKEVVDEAARRFEQAHPNVRILISTGPTNTLARQIQSGAPADVFVSASAVWSDAVKRQFPRAQSVDLTSNRLVLVVPKRSDVKITEPVDLTSPAVKRIAIAGEKVPAGMYSEQCLRSLEIFETLVAEKRLLRGRDVRSVLAYVHRGEVDAGMVYATDARLSDQVRIICSIDTHLHRPIVYSATLMSSSLSQENRSEGDLAFFEFLQTAETKAILKQHGFSELSSDPRIGALHLQCAAEITVR